jgi:hypothetical protein
MVISYNALKSCDRFYKKKKKKKKKTQARCIDTVVGHCGRGMVD